MKKIFTGILCFFLSQGIVSAQKLYVKGGLGYNASSGSSEIAVNTYNKIIQVDQNSYHYETDQREIVRGSYGAGLTGEVYLGYKLKENIAVETGFSYLRGKALKSDDIFDRSEFERNHKYFSRMPAFSSALIISTNETKLNPYAKAGFLIGKPNVYYQSDGKSNSGKYELDWKVTGKVSLGLQGGLGIRYALNEKLSVFGESNFTSMSFTAKKQHVIKSTTNGKDVTDSEFSKPYYAEREFYKSISGEEINREPSSSLDEPRKYLEYSLPLGSVGLQVGLQFNL